jgi:hypothetical protein
VKKAGKEAGRRIKRSKQKKYILEATQTTGTDRTNTRDFRGCAQTTTSQPVSKNKQASPRRSKQAAKQVKQARSKQQTTNNCSRKAKASKQI